MGKASRRGIKKQRDRVMYLLPVSLPFSSPFSHGNTNPKSHFISYIGMMSTIIESVVNNGF